MQNITARDSFDRLWAVTFVKPDCENVTDNRVMSEHYEIG